MSETSAATTAAPRRKKTSRTLFEYTGKPFALQTKENPEGLHQAAVAWLTVLKNAAKALGRDECLAELAKDGVNTGTSQAPIRIIYYWKKTLIDNGYIRTTRKDAQPATASAPSPSPAA